MLTLPFQENHFLRNPQLDPFVKFYCNFNALMRLNLQRWTGFDLLKISRWLWSGWNILLKRYSGDLGRETIGHMEDSCSVCSPDHFPREAPAGYGRHRWASWGGGSLRHGACVAAPQGVWRSPRVWAEAGPGCSEVCWQPSVQHVWKWLKTEFCYPSPNEINDQKSLFYKMEVYSPLLVSLGEYWDIHWLI